MFGSHATNKTSAPEKASADWWLIWYKGDEVVTTIQKRAHSGGKEDEAKACKILGWKDEIIKSHVDWLTWLNHVQSVIYRSYDHDITRAKFQILNRDPWDNSSEKSFCREKQKQCHFTHERTNTHKITSMACKVLSYLTCFNSDKEVYYAIMSQAKEEQKHPKRIVIDLVTFALKKLI